MSKRPSNEVLRQVVLAKGGIVSYVAEALKVSPRTVRRWKSGSPKIRLMFRETSEALLDMAEAALIKNIKLGRTADTIFFLKCFGRSRGYTERLEVSRPDGADLIPPDVAARRETERISGLMRDPEFREIQSRMLMVLDRVAGCFGPQQAGENGGRTLQ